MENEWHLRPLKKGTARLAITSWEASIPLTVIPTAINYSSFKNFGKEVHLFFGEPITKEEILSQSSDGKKLLAFNEQLNQQLEKLVYEIHPADKKTVRKMFSIKIKTSFYLLLLPAIAGAILHAPLFSLCKGFSKNYYDTGHYDSVFTAFLILTYPLYFLILFFIACSFVSWYSILFIFLMPFTAWAAVQAKYQLHI